MVECAERVIALTFSLPWERVHLVSGGAAWADHVAVRLFLAKHAGEDKPVDGPALTVHAPAAWDAASGRYVDNGTGSSWRTNPGYWENVLLERFASAASVSSFAGLLDAHRLGATIDTQHFGFHARNSAIATRAERLIAFTWSDGDAPTDGGTRDTWNKCSVLPKHHKIHIAMASLLNAPSPNTPATASYAQARRVGHRRTVGGQQQCHHHHHCCCSRLQRLHWRCCPPKALAGRRQCGRGTDRQR